MTLPSAISHSHGHGHSWKTPPSAYAFLRFSCCRTRPRLELGSLSHHQPLAIVIVMVILGRPLQALSPCRAPNSLVGPQFIGGGSLPYNLGRFRAPSLGVKDAYALPHLSQCLAIPHYVWIIRSSTKFTTWIVQSCRAIPCQRQGSVGHHCHCKRPRLRPYAIGHQPSAISYLPVAMVIVKAIRRHVIKKAVD
jgi:hypothetical protein